MQAGFALPTEAPLVPRTGGELAPVPSRFGGKVVGFVFLALAEYWVAPLFLGVTNYAGAWSWIGWALFGILVGSLLVFVIRPLWPRLQSALRTRPARRMFHAAWSGTLVAGLLVTNTFQVGGVPSVGSPALGAVTVYTPLGAWPSLTFLVPALRLFGTLNPEILGVLGLVSFLGSSAMLLSLQYSRRVCSTAKQANSGWPKRIPFLLVWAPLGLVTGCASCAPLYLVAVGLFAPSLVVGGLSGVPLVPWIGFAGLLYLLSLGLAVYLIRRTTARETLLPSEEGGGNPDG